MADNRHESSVTHYAPRGKNRFRCGVKITEYRWFTNNESLVDCDGCKEILKKGPKPDLAHPERAAR